jgi:putative tricarboxylic transport membrane protein
VLGNLAENSLRQALTISGGSFAIFITRPISALFIIAGVLAYLSPAIRRAFKGLGRTRVDVTSS